MDPGLIRAFDASGRTNVGHALDTVVMNELERRGADVTYVKTAAGFEVDMLARDRPVVGAPSTVLVKRERSRFPGLLQNELASMAMMASAGVPSAEHTVCALDAAVYETARFDRVCHADGSVLRLHAEDGCQLTGKLSRAKYAQTGGPTYVDLTAALRRYGTDPGTDTPLLFGGAQHLSQLQPAALKKAAHSFGLTPALAKDLVADVCDRLDAARDDALEFAERLAGPHEVLTSVSLVVAATTAETRRRLLG